MKKQLLLGLITFSFVLTGCAGTSASPQEKVATESPLSSPAASSAAPSKTATPVSQSDMKFFTGEGEEFQTFEDVQNAARFKVSDIPKVTDTIPLVVERMEKVANYRPSEKTVRASLNKPAGQLEREDYELVMEQYRLAHDVMFWTKSGDFYDTLKQICQQAAFNYLLTIDEEQPYAVDLNLHTKTTGLLISDNSLANTIDDNLMPYLGDYRLMSAGRDWTSDNGYWYVSGQMELLKQAG